MTPNAADMDVDWVKDHVTAALDYVGDAFILLLDDWSIQHVNTQFERLVSGPGGMTALRTDSASAIA